MAKLLRKNKAFYKTIQLKAKYVTRIYKKQVLIRVTHNLMHSLTQAAE